HRLRRPSHLDGRARYRHVETVRRLNPACTPSEDIVGDIDYQSLTFQESPVPTTQKRQTITIVGAGPVGMTLALDLAKRNIPVLLLDDDDRLSTGSRAICFAKRTLDIWDRLDIGQRM